VPSAEDGIDITCVDSSEEMLSLLQEKLAATGVRAKCVCGSLSLAPGIKDGDPRAVLAAIRIMERRAKLFGLDAPTTIAGPDGAPVTIHIVHRELPDAPLTRGREE
jgi:hypothetical protein